MASWSGSYAMPGKSLNVVRMLERAPSGTRISKPSAAMPRRRTRASPPRPGTPPAPAPSPRPARPLPHRVQDLHGRREGRVVLLLGRVVVPEIEIHAAGRPAPERLERLAPGQHERDARHALQALV